MQQAVTAVAVIARGCASARTALLRSCRHLEEDSLHTMSPHVPLALPQCSAHNLALTAGVLALRQMLRPERQEKGGGWWRASRFCCTAGNKQQATRSGKARATNKALDLLPQRRIRGQLIIPYSVLTTYTGTPPNSNPPLGEAKPRFTTAYVIVAPPSIYPCPAMPDATTHIRVDLVPLQRLPPCPI